MLELNSVTVRYRQKLLLEKLSFKVNPGEHYALVAEEDSDASILLDTIAGKYSIVEGSVSYDFAPEHSTSLELSKHIGYVAAHYHFRGLSNTSTFYYQQRFNMSDDDNAETAGEFLYDIVEVVGDNSHRWSFDKVVESLKISNLIERQLIMLSNGETRRVMIAAALIKNPKLLLLDHPLTGIDVETRQAFTQLLQEIIDSGIQVILSTSPSEIPSCITHVAALKDRRIKSTVPRDEFNPQDFTARITSKIEPGELTLLVKNQHEKYDILVGMKDVHVQYGDVQVLNGVNWTVRQGERWLLVGHNGAGKSTLLSLINGDNPQAYANDITLFDKQKGRGESIWALKQKIGYVSPELFRYFPMGSTCVDVIESGFYDTTGLFRKSDPEKRTTIVRWAKLLEIEDLLDRSFSNVPFNVQRLCLLARALVKSPALLILDEPCEGLSRNQQANFVELVDQLCKQTDITLIYVSHYQDQIPACIDHKITLERGSTIKV